MIEVILSTIIFFVVGFVISFIFSIFTDSTTNVQGNLLRAKFINIGTLTGKSFEEIISVVGPPNSSSSLEDEKILHQWITSNYHISLVFRDGICEGVTHETYIP